MVCSERKEKNGERRQCWKYCTGISRSTINNKRTQKTHLITNRASYSSGFILALTMEDSEGPPVLPSDASEDKPGTNFLRYCCVEKSHFSGLLALRRTEKRTKTSTTFYG
jgi:hypothetical protein